MESWVNLVETLGFPMVVAGGAVYYILKTSKDREAKMWETITGFQGVLTKFDGTLKDVAFGLRDVKTDLDIVKADVAELKDKSKGE